MTLEQRFAQSMGALLGPSFPSDIGLAVSGGGDSMAMLLLAHNWTRVWGLRLWVVTVDHGLRPEAAAEAAMVAEECAVLGHPHAVLRWHRTGQGNVMDAARRARLDLIDRWRGGLDHVLMAHTLDDVAETFLMRMKRGSGVEGLSAMAPIRRVLPEGRAEGAITGVCPPAPTTRRGGFRVVRPCLDMRRAELRHYLRALHGRWVDDPSNDDVAYDRVRMRQAMGALADLGLGPDVLAATAHRMARAGAALQVRALEVWRAVGQPGVVAPWEGTTPSVPTGEVLFDRTGFEGIERDTQLRLLAAALMWISGAGYRPRVAPLEALLDRLLGGGGGTLAGCEARMERDRLRVFREFAAVRDLVAPHGRPGLWDGRWRVFAPDLRSVDGVEIRALGAQGWGQAPDRPKGAPAFATARSLPALWQGDRLLACDALGVGPGHTTKLWPGGQEGTGFARFLSQRGFL